MTIRLFPPVHGTLIDELTKASRGLRAARAICLMTIGMLHERGHARGAALPGFVPASAEAGDSMVAMSSEDEAFVSSLLTAPDPEQ